VRVVEFSYKTWKVYYVTSVGTSTCPGVGAVPAQHVRLRDPVTRDRFIIGHVTGVFEQVGEACSGVAHR